MRKSIVRSTVVLTILIGIQVVCPRQSEAYLDPGTGSFMLQMLIASIVGGLFVLKIYFKKVKDLFKKFFCKGVNDEPPQE